MVVALILCAMRLVSGTANESLGEPDDALLLQTRAVGKTTCDEGLKGTKDADYRGCQTRTRSGRTCQNWNEQKPHAHSRTPGSERFSGKGLGTIWRGGYVNGNNYCRNPDGESTIWCYTTDKGKRWEYCDPLSGTPCRGGTPQEVPLPHTGHWGTHWKDTCDALAEQFRDCANEWIQCLHMKDVCSDTEKTLNVCSEAAHSEIFELPDRASYGGCSFTHGVKFDLINMGCKKYADAIQGPVFDALEQCQGWCPEEQSRCLEGPVNIVKALCYEHMDCFDKTYIDKQLSCSLAECHDDAIVVKLPAEHLFCGMCGFPACDFSKISAYMTPGQPGLAQPGPEHWGNHSGLVELGPPPPNSFSNEPSSQGTTSCRSGEVYLTELADKLQLRSDAGELNAAEHFARFEEVLSGKVCKQTCEEGCAQSADGCN